MLGDLHPHVMSIPFVLTMISVVANVLFSRAKWGFGWFRNHPIATLVMVVSVGSMGFINTWDMLWMLLALGGVVYFKSYRENGRSHIAAIRTGIPPFFVLTVIGAAVFFQLLLRHRAESDSVSRRSFRHGTRRARSTSSRCGAE